MKINDVSRISGIHSYKQANDARMAKTEVKKQKKDEVNISPQAMVLQVSKEANDQQVEKLKQSYLSGTYNVPAQEIAKKLLPYIQ